MNNINNGGDNVSNRNPRGLTVKNYWGNVGGGTMASRAEAAADYALCSNSR